MVIKRKRSEIECLVCPNIIKFKEYIGDDYSGDLFCDTCGSQLHIKLKKGEVRDFKVLKRAEQRKESKQLLKLQEQARELVEKDLKNDKGAD